MPRYLYIAVYSSHQAFTQQKPLSNNCMGELFVQLYPTLQMPLKLHCTVLQTVLNYNLIIMAFNEDNY